MGIQDRRARDLKRRRDDIIAAAVQLFDGDDWLSVTIEQIAERAEIGKGTVYKHFASKDELFATIALSFFGRLADALDTLPRSAHPSRRLRDIVGTYWRAYAALPPGVWRVVEFTDRLDFVRHLPPPLQAQYQTIGTRLNAVATDALTDGMSDGTFARGDVATAMFLAQSALMGAIRLRATGCVPTAREESYVDALADFIRQGLSAPGT